MSYLQISYIKSLLSVIGYEQKVLDAAANAAADYQRSNPNASDDQVLQWAKRFAIHYSRILERNCVLTPAMLGFRGHLYGQK
ncbi:hypothetical protein LPW36_02080 [Jinshanibacter sp. LJY008]|uniref:Uncharacterized protein n=1 Tax=Limnobaculum eriocheiris TaxID=2897391 RepID=A0A9X1SIW0_9GAMM|nr:hypothetical protein [Limnobaculum eriocheiris]MCD1124833.1 hypothetical protein [Limnobaculum eriocheiris]